MPTVVVGIGPAGLMLALIGRKIGAPWVTAALEKGMEAYPGQPTVSDLVDVYRYRDIGKKTRFVGVTGSGRRPYLAAGLLNAAFAHLDMPHRALPMQMGNRRHFRKIADAVRLQSVFVDEEDYQVLHEIGMLDETARSPVLAADCLAPTDDGWSASDLLGPAAAAAIEATIRDREPDGSLKGRTVMLAGCGALTRMLAGAAQDLRGISHLGKQEARCGSVDEPVVRRPAAFVGRDLRHQPRRPRHRPRRREARPPRPRTNCRFTPGI